MCVCVCVCWGESSCTLTKYRPRHVLSSGGEPAPEEAAAAEAGPGARPDDLQTQGEDVRQVRQDLLQGERAERAGGVGPGGWAGLGGTGGWAGRGVWAGLIGAGRVGWGGS